MSFVIARILPALLSLAAIWFFFADYLPPRMTAHFTYDFEGFHYPLLNYAFQSLKQGRLPEWDPTNYGGVPFCANIQAGMFYPPNWVLFWANWRRGGMSFHTIQILAVFHFWMGSMFGWHWLRGIGLRPPAAALGALTFTLGGFPLADLQHLGVVCGYMWIPLALAGVDGARKGESRLLWKTVVAGAMCILAGYPAMWFALSLAVIAYAMPEWRVAGLAFVVLLASLPLAAVQLLPTQEAATFRETEFVFGAPVDPRVLWQFIRPEYYKGVEAPWFTFLYLGAGFIAGSLWLIVKRKWPWRPLAMIAAAFVFVFDPYRSISSLLQHLMPSLRQVMQQWHFLAVLPAAAALLAARGADDFLASGVRWRTLAVAGLLLFTFAEFRHYGIHQPFNSKEGNVDKRYFSDARRGGPEFYGLSPTTFQLFRDNPQFRIIAPSGAPQPNDLRHYRLNSPQGFDPLLPATFKREVEQFVPFESNRLFTPDAFNERMLRNFGVRWILTIEGDIQNRLRLDPRFEPIGPDGYFFKAFELKQAQPSYQWSAGTVRLIEWKPEVHEFEVNSTTGGRFELLEQRYPGWTATVDGKDQAILPHSLAFQAIDVPAGTHRVRFEFRSKPMRIGAIISAASLLALGLSLILTRRKAA